VPAIANIARIARAAAKCQRNIARPVLFELHMKEGERVFELFYRWACCLSMRRQKPFFVFLTSLCFVSLKNSFFNPVNRWKPLVSESRKNRAKMKLSRAPGLKLCQSSFV
jgi:hypothetical protein